MTETLPPFALTAPVFPLRTLASAVSRAPVGGVRETLLAALVGARLASGALEPAPLPVPVRAERATAARHWMAALSLAAPVRAALNQLVDASIQGIPEPLQNALVNVIEVTAPHLDRKARSELERLAQSIRP